MKAKAITNDTQQMDKSNNLVRRALACRCGVAWRHCRACPSYDILRLNKFEPHESCLSPGFWSMKTEILEENNARANLRPRKKCHAIWHDQFG